MRNQWKSSLYPALAVVACALFVVGCGDDSADPDNGTANADTVIGFPDIQGTDTGAPDAGEEDTGAESDATGSTDTGVGSDTAGGGDTGGDAGGKDCPGGFGCACGESGDCDSGHCIETPAGKICTVTCVENCPSDDFKCVTTGSGADTATICVSKGGNLCNPCNSNNECQIAGHGDARCVDQGDAGAFCGTGCSSDNDCATGHKCTEVKDVAGATSKQCTPTAGSCACSDAAITAELSTTCYKTVGNAKCAGKRVCLADGKPNAPPGGGLSACLAETPDAESCDGQDNDCDGETDESTCDDNEECTVDACDAKDGCKHTNKSGPCDADGTSCTQDDVCKDGKCEAGKVLNCDDNNPCTKDTCDPKDGCKYENTQAPCNADDNDCTVADKCKEGKCVAGEAKSCDAGKECVTGSCSIVDGKCKYTVTDGFACNDGDQCTKDEKCVGELCKGQPLKCDDLDACTADSCDPKTGCNHKAATGPCDDGNACTEKDVCSSGKCQGSPADIKTKCGDNNDCTSDLCDPKSGCQNKPLDATDCDDGNTCTQGDKCAQGLCKSGENKCSCTSDADCKPKEDGNLCNGTLFCDKSGKTWECKLDPKTVVSCDTTKDGACATTVCQPGSGKCIAQPKKDGLACDADSSLCTQNDSCKSGVCTAGVLAKCDDNNPCTNDACDPAKGCVTTNNTAKCDADGDACTVDDTCKAGACVKGTPKDCDDNEPCTEDGCNKADGKCTSKQLSKSCDDGDVCTETDQCGLSSKTGKWTCMGSKPKDCDDKLGCTVDSCDPKTGCKHESAVGKAVACYTGDPKTKGVGVCKDGTQTCKNDGTLTACSGEVTPAQKEVCGDSKDNTCDGATDEGCAPTGVSGRLANAAVSGKSGKYTLRSSVGASAAVGSATGQGKIALDSGFYAWLKALLK